MTYVHMLCVCVCTYVDYVSAISVFSAECWLISSAMMVDDTHKNVDLKLIRL